MRSFLVILCLTFSFQVKAETFAECEAALRAKCESYGGKLLPFGGLDFYPGGSRLSYVYNCATHTGWTGILGGCSEDNGQASTPVSANGDNPVNACGSIIQIDNLALGEKISVVGTDASLIYFSNRVLGRGEDYSATISSQPNAKMPSNPSHTKILIAGRTLTQSYTSSEVQAGAHWDFTWDGKDSSGLLLPGATTAQIYFPEAAAHNTLDTSLNIILGGYNAFTAGLGGWNLSSMHFYDSTRQRLYLGNGEIREVGAIPVFRDENDNVLPNTQTPNAYLVTSSAGDEAYVFDLLGHHLETRSTKSGLVQKTFSYDDQGQISQIIDAFGNTTQVSKSQPGLITVTAPHGQVTTLTLNSNGWATSVTDPGGRRYKMTYQDSLGLLSTYQKPSGAISTLLYDSQGLLTKDTSTSSSMSTLTSALTPGSRTVDVISGEGHTSSYVVITNGPNYVRKEIAPGYATDIVTYQPGALSERAAASGFDQKQLFSPDPRFQSLSPFLSSLTDKVPSGDQSVTSGSDTVTSDPANILHLLTEARAFTVDGQAWTSNFQNSMLTATSPEGRQVQTTVDSFDRPVSLTVPGFTPAGFTYDANGRLHTIARDSRVTEFDYDDNGFLSSIKNPLQQVLQFSYNSHGEIATQTLPDNRIIQYNYDDQGNLSSITPPSSQISKFTYNLFDLLAQYKASAKRMTSYTYNKDKQVTKITKADSSTLVFSYTPATGLLSTITASDGIYTSGYNSANQLTSLSTPQNVSLFWDYDGNRLVTQSLFAPGFKAHVDYGYVTFLPVSETVTSGGSSSVINSTFDRDRLVKSAGDLQITRKAATSLVETTQLQSLQENFGYSAFGELGSYGVMFNGQNIFQDTYMRDDLGRIATETITDNGQDKTISYSYDPAGRLTDVYQASILLRHYDYDANSNRTAVSGTTQLSATYNTQDQLLTYGHKKFSYDALGERTVVRDSSGQRLASYSYDPFGNLVAATVNGVKITYQLDGFGHRIEKKKQGIATHYLYDSFGRLMAEFDDLGALKSRFIYATLASSPDYMINSGIDYKFIHDSRGSILKVVNSADGTITQQIDYDEFGRVTNDTSPGFQPFGFAGGMYDPDTSLVLFGARSYDSETGRWLSKDPILFGGGDTNLYSYVLQDPINLVDPNGKNPLLIGAIVGTGVAVGAINAISTYNQPGATFSKITQSFGAGFVTGAGAVTVGILTGGVPAAGALGLSLTGAGAIAGVVADLGLTALFAPYSSPSDGVANMANGVSAIKNNSSACPTP